MEDVEFSSLRADVASLKGDIAGIRATTAAQVDHNARVDSWLQNISDEVRKSLHQATPGKNNLPMIMALVTGAAVLISLGTFALSPVQQNVSDLQDRIEEVRKHDEGHPEYIIDRLATLAKLYERDRAEHMEITKRDEERMDRFAIDVAVLQTIAEERTQRFIRTLEQRDKLQGLMAKDRYTGSEQKAYSAAIEQRLRSLEKVTQQ